MPTVVETPVKAYAHCNNPRCPGYRQQQVDAVRREESYTYAERGGDLPGVEASWVRLAFLYEDEATCPSCHGGRDLSSEPRRQYAPLSGHDPNGLLDIEPSANGSRFDPALQSEIRSEAAEALKAEKAENAELRERLARLEGVLLGAGAASESLELGPQPQEPPEAEGA